MTSLLLLGTSSTLFAKSDFVTLKEAMDQYSIPLVNITVDMIYVNKARYNKATLEIADYHRRNPDSQFSVTYKCQIKLRGSSALEYEKKSFSVKLLDDNGNELESNVLGLREDDAWILDAMAIDRTRMRNRVCFDIWNQFSATPYSTDYGNRNGVVGQFVELFINGKYHGLYCLSDKINRKLLGLKKVNTDDPDNVKIKGILYKGVKWDNGKSSYLMSYTTQTMERYKWNAYELKYPDKYPSEVTWQPLADLIDFCSPATSDETFQDNWDSYFYYDNLMDYYVFTLALNVSDNVYKNNYLSVVNINKGHRFLITPWDMDASLGGDWDGDYKDEYSSVEKYYNKAPFNRLVSQNMDNFYENSVILWESVSNTIFSLDNVYGVLDKYAESFDKSGAWGREYKRWNKNPVELSQSIYSEINYVKEWYKNNRDNLTAQFRNEVGATTVPFMEYNDMDIYDIRGNRIYKELYELPKGIYFINGQKVFITPK